MADAWEAVLADMLRGHSEAEVRENVAFCAKLLRKDALPACGRAFVADILEKLVDGRPALPRRTKPQKHKPLAVLVAVLREVEGWNSRTTTPADIKKIYKTIAGRLEIEIPTVENLAAKGRAHVRRIADRDAPNGAARDRSFH